MDEVHLEELGEVDRRAERRELIADGTVGLDRCAHSRGVQHPKHFDSLTDDQEERADCCNQNSNRCNHALCPLIEGIEPG